MKPTNNDCDTCANTDDISMSDCQGEGEGGRNPKPASQVNGCQSPVWLTLVYGPDGSLLDAVRGKYLKAETVGRWHYKPWLPWKEELEAFALMPGCYIEHRDLRELLSRRPVPDEARRPCAHIWQPYITERGYDEWRCLRCGAVVPTCDLVTLVEAYAERRHGDVLTAIQQTLTEHRVVFSFDNGPVPVELLPETIGGVLGEARGQAHPATAKLLEAVKANAVGTHCGKGYDASLNLAVTEATKAWADAGFPMPHAPQVGGPVDVEEGDLLVWDNGDVVPLVGGPAVEPENGWTVLLRGDQVIWVCGEAPKPQLPEPAEDSSEPEWRVSQDCPLCASLPHAEGSEQRRCAFRDGVFDYNNWCCATLGALAEIADKADAWQGNDRDERVALLPIPDCDEDLGEFLVLQQYKRRGTVRSAVVFHDKGYAPLTLDVARKLMRRLRRPKPVVLDDEPAQPTKPEFLSPGRYLDTDGTKGTLSEFDQLANCYTFKPDGVEQPAILGPGFPSPYRRLGREEAQRLVPLDAGQKSVRLGACHCPPDEPQTIETCHQSPLCRSRGERDAEVLDTDCDAKPVRGPNGGQVESQHGPCDSGGMTVTDFLVSKEGDTLLQDIHQLAFVLERLKAGHAKYGQPLRMDWSRAAEARDEELADAIAYSVAMRDTETAQALALLWAGAAEKPTLLSAQGQHKPGWWREALGELEHAAVQAALEEHGPALDVACAFLVKALEAGKARPGDLKSHNDALQALFEAVDDWDPEAPVCEGCPNLATTADADGIPLCPECVAMQVEHEAREGGEVSQ